MHYYRNSLRQKTAPLCYSYLLVLRTDVQRYRLTGTYALLCTVVDAPSYLTALLMPDETWKAPSHPINVILEKER